MAIPDFQSIMLPVLTFLGDGNTKRTKEIISYVINTFHISQEDTKLLIPSGRAKLIDNRVEWACTHLRKAGLIESPQRSINQITEDGKAALKNKPAKITLKFLENYPKYNEFRKDQIDEEKKEDNNKDNSIEKTPEEIIGFQSEILNTSIKTDLLDYLSKVDPSMFEQIVVDLLVNMGYGGTVEDAGQAIGQTNDGGIDGIIKEDVLGLDTIFIQAKRWQNTVPIKEVMDFAGALLSKKSTKGVFITTSSFPDSAYEFVNKIDRKIILIDGNKLSDLMFKFNLGVTRKTSIEIKEIDTDYFLT